MIEAPVDQPWDLEVALSAFHGVRLELHRAAVDLRDALGELVEPFLDWLSRVLTK